MTGKPAARFIRSLPIRLPRPHPENDRVGDRAAVTPHCDSAELAAAIEGAFDAGPADNETLIATSVENSAGPNVRRALRALPNKVYATERVLWNELTRKQRRPQ
ncbi:MAG: hypothetical protein HQ526_00560 [Actinobacteria bacterium]|nr:hypothetical protein [Actinomycetota bacterium]